MLAFGNIGELRGHDAHGLSKSRWIEADVVIAPVERACVCVAAGREIAALSRLGVLNQAALVRRGARDVHRGALPLLAYFC